MSVSGQEDDFPFSDIVFTYRLSTGTCFITECIFSMRTVDTLNPDLLLFTQTNIKNINFSSILHKLHKIISLLSQSTFNLD